VSASGSGPIPDGAIRLTIPKVGAGFQAGTFGLLAWIGSQANTAWQELQTGIGGNTRVLSSLVERVDKLEGQERADEAVRQARDALDHSVKTRRELLERIALLEECHRDRKTCEL